MKITTIYQLYYNCPLPSALESFNYMPHNTYFMVGVGLSLKHTIQEFKDEFTYNMLNDPDRPMKTTVTPLLINPAMGHICTTAKTIHDHVMFHLPSAGIEKYAEAMQKAQTHNIMGFIKNNLLDSLCPDIKL